MKHPNYSSDASAKAASFLLLMLCFISFFSPAYAIENPYAAFGDGDGNIYTIPADGKLRWLQHTGRMTGAVTWTNNGAAKATNDSTTKNNWLNNKIFSGGDGVIYTVNNAGQLLWSRHDGRFIGSQDWVNRDKTTLLLSSNWNKYQHVFSGGNGVIFAITTDGKMLWFRHDGWLSGSKKWADGSGKQIASGWQGAVKVFSGGNGVIYSILPNGRLRYNRYDDYLTGASNWDSWFNGGVNLVVGYPPLQPWQDFKQVFSSGDGIIYAIKANGDMFWYRHTGWLTGAETWLTNAGKLIKRDLILR